MDKAEIEVALPKTIQINGRTYKIPLLLTIQPGIPIACSQVVELLDLETGILACDYTL